MPIEIREIIIKANVNQSNVSSGATGAVTSAGSAQAGSDADLIEETVEQVMQIIQDKKER